MTDLIYAGMLRELAAYHRYHHHQIPKEPDMSLTTDAAEARTALENALHWAEEALTRHAKVAAGAAEADAIAAADAADPLAQAVAAAGNLPAEARELAAKVITDLAAMYPEPEAAESPESPAEGDTQAEAPPQDSQDATGAPEAATDAA